MAECIGGFYAVVGFCVLTKILHQFKVSVIEYINIAKGQTHKYTLLTEVR